jgi:uncharacterized protein YjbI with pentapeptide repeats
MSRRRADVLGDLTADEERIKRNVAAGEPTDLRQGRAEGPRPMIRAALLESLCLSFAEKDGQDPRVVDIAGARFEGSIDLSNQFIGPVVSLMDCDLPEINLNDAHLMTWRLTGSRIHSLTADRAIVEGSLFLDRVEVAAGIKLRGGSVTDQVSFSTASLHGGTGAALDADGLTVGRDVHLNHGFLSRGEVRLSGAQIGRQLNCTRGRFYNERFNSIFADGLVVAEDVFLDRGFISHGQVSLVSARIGRQLCCTNGRFEDRRSRSALNLDRAEVGGDLYLNSDNGLGTDGARHRFVAHGTIRLQGTHIGRQLTCSGGYFQGPAGEDPRVALLADGIDVDGDVFLDRGFTAKGVVRLIAADIGRQLNCTNGVFESVTGEAIDAAMMNVGTDVYLNSDPLPSGDGSSGAFRVIGAARFEGASVGRDLNCDGATVGSGTGIAFDGRRMTVAGYGSFRNATAKGRILLEEARLQRLNLTDLRVEVPPFPTAEEGTEPVPEGSRGVVAAGIRVDGEACMTRLWSSGAVILNYASIGHRLDLCGAQLASDIGYALHAREMTVDAELLLGPSKEQPGIPRATFRADGGATFAGSSLGAMDCAEATFTSSHREATPDDLPPPPTLDASHLRVAGRAGLSRMVVHGCGGICLYRLEVNRTLDLNGIEVGACGCSPAFDARGARIDGEAVWTPSRIQGKVLFTDAKVGTLKDDLPEADRRRTRVGDRLDHLIKRDRAAILGETTPHPGWHPQPAISSPHEVDIETADAHQRHERRADDQPKVDLTGLEYRRLEPLRAAAARNEWLRCSQYSPQPYAQLASCYRRSGELDDAVRVSIERYRRRASEGYTTWHTLHARIWSRILGATVGYGYRPHRVLYWLVVAWVSVALILGANDQHMIPSGSLGSDSEQAANLAEECTSDYPCFSAWVYAMDTLLPVIDLQQAAAWRPDVSTAPTWLVGLLYVSIGLGWLLGASLIAGVGNVWRRQ